VIRELGYRRHVYRHRVANGKMSPHQAQVEISLMEAIVEDYRALARKDELPLGDLVES
jgi:hypothetical protein